MGWGSEAVRHGRRWRSFACLLLNTSWPRLSDFTAILIKLKKSMVINFVQFGVFGWLYAPHSGLQSISQSTNMYTRISTIYTCGDGSRGACNVEHVAMFNRVSDCWLAAVFLSFAPVVHRILYFSISTLTWTIAFADTTSLPSLLSYTLAHTYFITIRRESTI